MRWERLFGDLEAQLAAEGAVELDAEVADRTRAELARTSFEDRLRGVVGREVVLVLAEAEALRGRLRQVGAGWLIVDDTSETSAIVILAAVTGVRDLPVSSRGAGVDGAVAGRLGIGQVLRVLARDRTPTSVALRDGTRVTGTIDRVGANYFDLAEHPLDEPRRHGTATTSRTIPLAAVAVMRPRAG
jgi:hypothetical protein